jgi:hypothetical protein
LATYGHGMHREDGSREVVRMLAGGVLLGAITAGLIALWAWANDRPECSGEVFACLGAALAVALIGFPAALVVAWLGLRTLGTRSPALAVALTCLVALFAPSALSATDPPIWVWPAGVGAVGCVVIALLEANSRPSNGAH